MKYYNNKLFSRCFLLRLVIISSSIFLFSCQGVHHATLGLGEEYVDGDEAKTAEQLISTIKAISLQRYPEGKVKRFNQAKSLGCFDATFTVAKDLPENFQQGVFGTENEFLAKVRFANATENDDREKDFRGMSIKLFDVPGEPLLGESGQQDFILNSHPVLFAANPEDFLDFVEATEEGAMWKYLVNPSHFYSLKILLLGRNEIANPFSIRYWSTTPYRFGNDKSQAVKYSVQSCPKETLSRHSNFLTDAMERSLTKATACFDFMVQFQTDPIKMPIENASVEWDETLSPFIKVATITIDGQGFDNQDFRSKERMKTCEAMTFNPWQTLEAHKPLGGINRVRKAVYTETSGFRHSQNSLRNPE